MSFALYGPVKTWAIGTYSPAINIHLAGDKMWIYRRDDARFSLYDLNLNEITLLKSTYDFTRSHYLAIHRLNKLPEFYSGYGDGVSPRCPKPYGTCASELERYTYGSSTTELLCPNENCEEGNVNDMLYDVKTGKLIVSTSYSGNKIYLVDPDTKTFTKWSARGAGMTTHYHVKVIAHDDTYLYVGIKKYPESGGSLEIRRYKVDEFYANFGSGAIEDYGEQVYYEASTNRLVATGDIMTFAPNRPTIQLIEPSTLKGYEYDPVTNTIVNTIPYYYNKRYIGKYALRPFDNYLNIYDLDTHEVVQTLNYPAGQTVVFLGAPQDTDPIFMPLQDTSNIYIYLLTYNGIAPVIEYNHESRKIRVVDFITKNTVKAELWVWRSRFCFCRDKYPTGISPGVLVVNDWTPIPTAYKTECLTFAIKSVTS